MMNLRRLSILTTMLFLLSLTATNRVNADDKGWLEFFAGKWTAQNRFWTEADGWTEMTATRETELMVNGNVVVEKRLDANGDTAIAMIGWNAATKAIVETGYTSDGLTWTATYDSVTEDSLAGSVRSAAPDGESGKGTIKIDKASGNSFTAEWEVKTSKGRVIKGRVSVTRKPD